MTWLKHYISAFICLCLIAAPVIFSVSFLLKQYHIRLRMEEQLEKQLLQTVSLHKKNVQWIKQGKELRVNGHMFDVKSAKAIGDTIQLTGIYDEAEDELNGQLENILDTSNQENSAEPFIKMINIIFVKPISKNALPVIIIDLIVPSYIYIAYFPVVSLSKHLRPPKS